jgi:hypothetical protein
MTSKKREALKYLILLKVNSTLKMLNLSSNSMKEEEQLQSLMR